MSLSIAIAGGGLLGSLIAWRLLQVHTAKTGQDSSLSVTIFEKHSLSKPRSAAHTAAAMISPLSEVVASERAIYDMGIASLGIWPAWLRELEALGLPEVQYQDNGSIVVAHPSDHAELTQFAADLNHHLGSDNTASWLTSTELREREPDLSSQFREGLLLPKEAALDNRQLLQNLQTAIIKLGGKIHENADITLHPAPLLNGNPLTGFDLIIDTRGTGAKDHRPVRGVRGEVLWVQTPEVRLNHAIRLMHPRYKLYIVPKPGQRFIIGATEIESSDTSPVSVQSMMELCSALYTLNPAFAEARILELDANLRPCYLDNMPHTEWHSSNQHNSQQQCVSINGLYRHGYLLAPYVVEQFLADFNARFY